MKIAHRKPNSRSPHSANPARRRGSSRSISVRAHAEGASSPSITSAPEGSKEADVLNALRNVIDPDFGEDIVNCGFIKDLRVSDDGDVMFTLELTTPACPVKEEFDSGRTLDRVLGLAGPGVDHRMHERRERNRKKEAQHPPQPAENQDRRDNRHRMQVIHL